jgi:hypothetical protein
MKVCSFTLLLSPLLLSNDEVSAFSNSWRQQPLAPAYTMKSVASSSLLLAKKRRRRKDSSPIVSAPSSDGDLPDFDDPEDDADVEQPTVQLPVAVAASSFSSEDNSSSRSKATIKRGSGLNAQLAEELGGNVDGLDEDFILESMRGKKGESEWQPPQSISETLRDRSLEKFMNFEKMIEQDGGGDVVADLPDFDEVIARRKQREGLERDVGTTSSTAFGTDGGGVGEGMGKKAARNAQRKAAALQREADVEADKSPFEGVNILKLLENGAWVGIGLLVLWEFYINSPFFERAAPLIPVVYDDVKPPGM